MFIIINNDSILEWSLGQNQNRYQNNSLPINELI